MDHKEVVSGYRHPLLEFSDSLAQWYRDFKLSQTGSQRRQYPADDSPYWIVHVLQCFTSVPPAGLLKKAGVSRSTLDKYDGKSILMVTDASGLPLGFDILDQGWSSCLYLNYLTDEECSQIFHKVVRLLQRCMDAPMGVGTPRQPRGFMINDEVLHSLLHQQMLKQGSKCMDVLWTWGPRSWDLLGEERARAFSLRWPPVWYCNVCKRRSFATQLQECSQCRAVFYCENKCLPADCEHEHWCAKLATYMDHEAQLADLPFSYTAEVTSENFSVEDFLLKNKLVSSYWLYWSLLVRCPQPQIIFTDAYCSWLKDHSYAYEPLKLEAEVLMFGPDPDNVPNPQKPLVSWHQYYEWRGLSLTSVVAPLLSSALSVYYIITSLVPKYFPEMDILQKQFLRIHIVESYREFHTMLTFWELSVLLPHVTFELVFICGHLPSWCDQLQLLIHKTNGSVTITDSLVPHHRADKRSVRVRVHRCSYHKLQEPNPDLVVSFRPAFQLNDFWFSFLPKLQSLRVPAFFCEISELRCESSEEVMNTATGGSVSPPTINPFHCPLRINGGDNRLPRYSNSFIFHLMYKASANVPQPQPVINCRVQSHVICRSEEGCWPPPPKQAHQNEQEEKY